MARAKLPYKAGGAEFGLDTMREQDEDEADGGQGEGCVAYEGGIMGVVS